METIIQIIVIKETEHAEYPEYKIKGPFALRIFDVAYDKDSSIICIITEGFESNLLWLLKTYVNKDNSEIVADFVIKLSVILAELYKKLAFNHRFFKSVNICYVVDASGNIMPRICEFANSCIKYNALTINDEKMATKLCNLKGRDLTLLLFEISFYHNDTCVRLIPVLHALLTFERDGKICDLLSGDCVKRWEIGRAHV